MRLANFNQYAPHDDASERLAFLFRTRDRLLSFAERKAGWDLGRGEPIRIPAIRDALELLPFAFSRGIWRSNVFASPSGSVLLTFTMSKHDLEIGVEGDGTFDFCYEYDGDVVYEGQELDRPAVEKALEESAKKICTSEQSTQTIMTPPLAVSAARHSSLRVTEVCRFSVKNVQKAQAAQSVSTSLAITATSLAIHQYSGFYQPPLSRQEALCA